MLYILLANMMQIFEEERLTKAVHDIKENDEQDCSRVHEEACLAHVERSFGHVLAPSKEIGENGKSIGHGGKNDEGASKIRERDFAA
jgi:hypothetical protein